MLKNPWSEHVTPSENYNPVWTGIPNSQPSSRPSQKRAFGDLKALQTDETFSAGPSSSSTPDPDKAKFYIFYDKELAHEKSKQLDKKRSILSYHVPPLRRDPSSREMTQNKKESPKYCFGCEKALVYRLFTETLKIKRKVEEVKYRSKDDKLKYNLKLRRGTTPVHAYWPTKTWDADHWPLLPNTKLQEKLNFTNQSEDVLQHALKKQKDARCDIQMFSRC
ncbi:unnamed protein product [Calypogeia fissa]